MKITKFVLVIAVLSSMLLLGCDAEKKLYFNKTQDEVFNKTLEYCIAKGYLVQSKDREAGTITALVFGLADTISMIITQSGASTEVTVKTIGRSANAPTWDSSVAINEYERFVNTGSVN